jgi:hypothetical protein
VVPVSPHATATELDFLLRDSGARIAIGDAETGVVALCDTAEWLAKAAVPAQVAEHLDLAMQAHGARPASPRSPGQAPAQHHNVIVGHVTTRLRLSARSGPRPAKQITRAII